MCSYFIILQQACKACHWQNRNIEKTHLAVLEAGIGRYFVWFANLFSKIIIVGTIYNYYLPTWWLFSILLCTLCEDIIRESCIGYWMDWYCYIHDANNLGITVLFFFLISLTSDSPWESSPHTAAQTLYHQKGCPEAVPVGSEMELDFTCVDFAFTFHHSSSWPSLLFFPFLFTFLFFIFNFLSSPPLCILSVPSSFSPFIACTRVY